MTMVRIHETQYDRFVSAVARLTAKALRNVNATVNYTIVGKDGHTLLVDIEDVKIIQNGWNVVSYVERNNNNNVHFSIAGAAIPEQYIGEGQGCRCDHCGQNRRRTKMYVVVNSDGEYRQVGSSCMEEFVGINPAVYVKALEKFRKEVETFGSVDFASVVFVEKIIQDTYRNSAWIAKVKIDLDTFTEKFRAFVADDQNIQAILKDGYILPSNGHSMALLRNSLLACFRSLVEPEAKPEAKPDAKTETKHVGVVGEEFNAVVVVEEVKPVVTAYGFTYLYKFNYQGQQVVAFNRRRFDVQGLPKAVSGIVSKHDHFKGEASTTLRAWKFQ